MGKHTPGPWTVGESNATVFAKGGCNRICRIECDDVSEMIPNANLIAAAPELLESLQKAICWLQRIQNDYPTSLNEDAIQKHLQPAIAKATGAA